MVRLRPALAAWAMGAWRVEQESVCAVPLQTGSEAGRLAVKKAGSARPMAAVCTGCLALQGACPRSRSPVPSPAPRLPEPEDYL